MAGVVSDDNPSVLHVVVQRFRLPGFAKDARGRGSAEGGRVVGIFGTAAVAPHGSACRWIAVAVCDKVDLPGNVRDGAVAVDLREVDVFTRQVWAIVGFRCIAGTLSGRLTYLPDEVGDESPYGDDADDGDQRRPGGYAGGAPQPAPLASSAWEHPVALLFSSLRSAHDFNSFSARMMGFIWVSCETVLCQYRT